MENTTLKKKLKSIESDSKQVDELQHENDVLNDKVKELLLNKVDLKTEYEQQIHRLE